MGCGGQREKGPPEQTQKWAYLSLADFKSTSAWNTIAYIWLWFMAFVAVAVYTADTYTAVNLLAFNNWTMKIQPALDIKYSRWIFAGCILFSWVLAILEWVRAIRVIRRGGVADTYMDPLAVTLQSMRTKGWRRFLVLSALTKSKKGADYVAFFVYFAFKGAIRVVVAEGPRQVINGMTLYAVMKSDLFGAPDEGNSSIEQFWDNLQHLFEDNKVQAMTMVTMLFTLVIWIISALSLIIATVLYVVFLWHYIPQADGRLSIYCRRKIDRRLEKIVASKVQAAIEDEERAKRKAEDKAQLKRQKTGEPLPPTKPELARQPTLPQIATPQGKSDDKLPEFALNRQNTSTTVSTLPVYTSRPPTRNGNGDSTARLERQPTLPDYSEYSAPGRPAPSRLNTDASGFSTTSYESDAPLLANAGYAGEAAGHGVTRPSNAFSRQQSDASFRRPLPGRTVTQGSQNTQRSFTPGPPGPPGRSYTSNSMPRQPMGPRMPVRTNTGMSHEQEPRSAVTPISPEGGDYYARPSVRYNTPDTFNNPPYSRHNSNSSASFSTNNRPPPPSAISRQPTYGSTHSHSSSFSRPMPSQQQQRQPSNPQIQPAYRPFSPAVSQDVSPPPPAPLQPQLQQADSFEMMPQRSYTPSHNPTPPLPPTSAGGYVPFNPSLNAHSAAASPAPAPLQRSVTALGGGGQSDYFGPDVHATVPQRSATAPLNPGLEKSRGGARETMGYADIFDAYGAGSAAASPDEQPPQQQQRYYGSGPAQRW